MVGGGRYKGVCVCMCVEVKRAVHLSIHSMMRCIIIFPFCLWCMCVCMCLMLTRDACHTRSYGSTKNVCVYGSCIYMWHKTHTHRQNTRSTPSRGKFPKQEQHTHVHTQNPQKLARRDASWELGLFGSSSSTLVTSPSDDEGFVRLVRRRRSLLFPLTDIRDCLQNNTRARNFIQRTNN